MKTRYQIHKTFKNSAKAEQYIKAVSHLFPNHVFSVKKRTWPNKIKARYTVRSLLK